MSISSQLRIKTPLTLVLLWSMAARHGVSQVLVVDSGGGGDHATVQEAIDAIPEGGLVLVRPGVYQGFTVAGKAVSIEAVADHVRIDGYATIWGLSRDRSVLLRGIEFRQPSPYQPCVRVEACEGDVRFFGCKVVGKEPVYSDDRETVVRITASDRVAWIASEIQGGWAANALGVGFRGSDAIHLEFSTVAMYDSSFRGGRGGDGTFVCPEGGDGGDGVWSDSPSILFASSSTLTGGQGGFGDCGNGAHGAAVRFTSPQAMSHSLGCTLVGGVVGPSQTLPFAPRRLQVVGNSYPNNFPSGRVMLNVQGEYADRVHLLPSDGLDFRLLIGTLAGCLLVDADFAPVRAIGGLPPSGSINQQVLMPKEDPETGFARLHLLALIRTASGEWVISNPVAVTRIDMGLVDCDGNGTHDEEDIHTFVLESPWLGPIGAGMPQSFAIPKPPPAASSLRIGVQARADLQSQHRRIAVHLNGSLLGWLFRSGASSCPSLPDEAELFLLAEEFQRLVGEGDALFELIASDSVDPFACDPEQSQVRIRVHYLSSLPLSDCNGDGILDRCQSEDCNENGIPDICDILDGTSSDVDGNLVPDECQRFPRYYVDIDQVGFADGGSWATAHRDLQKVLDLIELHAPDAVEVWMAGGAYRPDRGTGNRQLRFFIRPGTSIYGGFEGGERHLEERDILAHPTILTGDLLGNDNGPPVHEGDNSFRVVEFLPGPGARLDGLTITGGQAIVPSIALDGAGVFVQGSDKVLANCTFRWNYADRRGGAISGDTAFQLIDCTFVENWAKEGGGALHMVHGGEVRGSLFLGNRNTCCHGGASWASGVLFHGCRFFDNLSPAQGGALYLTGQSSLLVNCLFHDNLSMRGGALASAEMHPGSQLEIHNCTFAFNRGTFDGGGVFLSPSSRFTSLSNCILWGNTDATGSSEQGQIWIAPGIPVSIAYSQIQGLQGSFGPGNLGGDPLFRDPLGPDGVAGTLDDDFRLPSGSPCVDSGDKTYLPEDFLDLDLDGDYLEPWPIDLDGLPRLVDDPGTPDSRPGSPPHLDRGAYELPSGG